MSEWSMEPALNTGGRNSSVGSNPTPSADSFKHPLTGRLTEED